MALSDLEVGDEEVEVTRWLEESGRRRVDKKWRAKLSALGETRLEEPASRRYLTQPSTLYLLALTAVSYLLFFFADVELQITTMRRIVVFVFG